MDYVIIYETCASLFWLLLSILISTGIGIAIAFGIRFGWTNVFENTDAEVTEWHEVFGEKWYDIMSFVIAMLWLVGYYLIDMHIDIPIRYVAITPAFVIISIIWSAVIVYCRCVVVNNMPDSSN